MRIGLLMGASAGMQLSTEIELSSDNYVLSAEPNTGRIHPILMSIRKTTGKYPLEHQLPLIP